jgi:ATP-dependent DNA helicase RecQ
MVFYAQTAFCRWRVLLEHFEETPPFDERCGHCDNCLHPVVTDAEQPRQAVAAGAQPIESPFKPGDPVRVPRYGPGAVARVAGDEVTVVFPDRSTRTFVGAYVEAR